MRSLFVFVPLLCLASCAESELSVSGTTTELPARFDGEDTFHAFTVRNIGEGALTIESVSFSDDGGGNFFGADTDITEMLGGDQAVVGFFYRTPGGIAQSAVLNIASTATANPSLDVELTTTSAVNAPDAGPPDAGGEDAGDPDDAGVGGPDAGAPDAAQGADAGAPDAADGVDAGSPDGG